MPSIKCRRLQSGHSVDLVIVFRQNVLVLFELCPWLKQARVIDRTDTLKTRLLRKRQPPNNHCEGNGLVGHVNHESTASLVGIQIVLNKGFGDEVCAAPLYNVSYGFFVLSKWPLAHLPSVRATKERQVSQCAARLPLRANPIC